MGVKAIPFPHKQYGMYYVEEDFRDAAYRGDEKRLNDLLKAYPNLNINAVNEYAETALYIACKHNQNRAAALLLKQPGIDVNLPTILGNSPLLISAWNDNTALAKLLIHHNADVNARTKAERQYHGNVSALDIAQERGNNELVELLAPLVKVQQSMVPRAS